FSVRMHSSRTWDSTKPLGAPGSALESWLLTALASAETADWRSPSINARVVGSGSPRGCASAVTRLSSVAASGMRNGVALAPTVNWRARLILIPLESMTCTCHEYLPAGSTLFQLIQFWAAASVLAWPSG